VTGLYPNEIKFVEELMKGTERKEAVIAVYGAVNQAKAYANRLLLRPSVMKLLRRMFAYGEVVTNTNITRSVIDRIIADPDATPSHRFNTAVYLHKQFGYGNTSNANWKYDPKRKEASEKAYLIIRDVAEDKDAALSVSQKAAAFLHEHFGEGAEGADKPGETDVDSLEGEELDEYIEGLEKKIRDFGNEDMPAIDRLFPKVK